MHWLNSSCLLLLILTKPLSTSAQESHPVQPDPQLSKLAGKMCSQLPNVALLPFKSELSGDDVHDTLVMLGPLAVPCLVDRITDDTWMPDPRQAPVAPDVRAGDIAFFILTRLGVDFDVVLPMLDKEQWEGVGIYAYFAWARRPGSRERLQQAVRDWLQSHPHCCQSALKIEQASTAQPVARLNRAELSQLQNRLAQLQPGVDDVSILETLGSPDLTRSGEFDWGMSKRGEESAAVYFVERWSDSPKKCDHLRDRYVALFFTKQGKFVRMFSNVESIPPIFPADKDDWFRSAWPDGER